MQNDRGIRTTSSPSGISDNGGLGEMYAVQYPMHSREDYPGWCRTMGKVWLLLLSGDTAYLGAVKDVYSSISVEAAELVFMCSISVEEFVKSLGLIGYQTWS